MDLQRETGVGLIPRAGAIRSTHGERGDQTRGRADVIRCLGQRFFGNLRLEEWIGEAGAYAQRLGAG